MYDSGHNMFCCCLFVLFLTSLLLVFELFCVLCLLVLVFFSRSVPGASHHQLILFTAATLKARSQNLSLGFLVSGFCLSRIKCFLNVNNIKVVLYGYTLLES